jgi:hypothetical protein
MTFVTNSNYREEFKVSLQELIGTEFLSVGCLNCYLHMKAEFDEINSDGASERLIL